MYNHDQMEYLQTALATGIWYYDNEPNSFTHPNDGKVIWLKCASSRLRIADNDTRLYTNSIATRMAHYWPYAVQGSFQTYTAKLNEMSKKRGNRTAYNTTKALRVDYE